MYVYICVEIQIQNIFIQHSYINFINLLNKSLFFKILFIYFQGGDGRENERERNTRVWLPLEHPLLATWPATQACALMGNQTGDPLVRSPALSPLSHTSQSFMQRYFKSGQICILPKCVRGQAWPIWLSGCRINNHSVFALLPSSHRIVFSVSALKN